MAREDFNGSGSSGGGFNLNFDVPTPGVCPITVQDVANSRGVAFLTLTPEQQQACGGFNGDIYQQGLAIAFEEGRKAGLPEIDLSDDEDAIMWWRRFEIWLTNTMNNPFSGLIVLGGLVLLVVGLFRK